MKEAEISLETYLTQYLKVVGKRSLAMQAVSPVALVISLFVVSALTTGSAQAVELPVEGGPGGSSFRDGCPGSRWLVGFQIRAGAWVEALTPICADFDSIRGEFTSPSPQQTHGGPGGRTQDGNCPQGSYVSGIRFGYTREGGFPKYVDYVEITCRPMRPGSDDTTICLQTGDGCWLVHPNPPGIGVPFLRPPFDQACPIGEAGVGIQGRSGLYIDALGLVCGPRPVMTIPARRATARNDVDIYDGPGGEFRVIGMMEAGTSAPILEYHPDGWCKLGEVADGADGWVAEDHLAGCP